MILTIKIELSNKWLQGLIKKTQGLDINRKALAIHFIENAVKIAIDKKGKIINIRADK